MSIYEFLLAVRSKVKKRLPISIIVGLLVAAIVTFVVKQKPVEYYATTKIFPLSANSARSSSSPLSQLQQQFGIKSESDGEVYDMQELISSKRLAFKIAGAHPINKKYNHFYQWLIADHNAQLGWFDKEIPVKEEAKDSLRNLITGRGLLLGRVLVEKGENGYTTLTVMAYEKELAKEIAENILIALSDFYIEFTTEKPRTDLFKIQDMRDSLAIQLTQVDQAIAGVQDKSAFATSAFVGLPQIRLKRKQVEIQTLYSSTVNALQNAKFKLLSESPIFQVLDYPGEPYITEKPEWKLPAVVTFLFVVIILSLWFCRKIFGGILKEELMKA